MKFNPLTEAEVADLMPVGEYDFYVKEAKDTVSKKSGAEMIKLTLGVIDKNGRERTIFDYLIDSMMYKVKHFADSVGLEKEYESGGYSAIQCENQSGKCKIIIDEPDPASPYSPKNAIKDYVKRDPNAASVQTAPAKTDDLFNDDLPF